MTTKEAGAELGVGASRIRQYIQDGDLIPEKFGHLNSIPTKQVLELKDRLLNRERKQKGRRPKIQDQ